MELLTYIRTYGSEIAYNYNYAHLAVDNLISLLLGAGKQQALGLLSDIDTVPIFNALGEGSHKQYIFGVVLDGTFLRRTTELESKSAPASDSIYHDVFGRGYYVKEGVITPVNSMVDLERANVQYLFKDIGEFYKRSTFGNRLENTPETKPLTGAVYALTHYVHTLAEEIGTILATVKDSVDSFNTAYSQLETDFEHGIDETMKANFLTKFNSLYGTLENNNLVSTLTALKNRISLDDVEVANAELGKVSATIQGLGTLVTGIGATAQYAQSLGTLFGAKWQTAAGVLTGAIQSTNAITSAYQGKMAIIKDDIKRMLETL